MSIVSSWPQGYVTDMRVTNTGTATINGWTVSLTLPSGQSITNFWNANVSPTSGAVTARNLSYNGNLGPNASTTFGFQASRSSGNALPTNLACTAS
jgi:cellulase/cellobiase CelA1